MYSPALVTYTFFCCPQEKEERINQLSNIGEKFPLNFSRSINAFNLIFGGSPHRVPLCEEKHVERAKFLLKKGLIDAFCAGLISDKNKAEIYYEGNTLGISLILAHSSGRSKINEFEVRSVTHVICSKKHINLKLSGFEESIRPVIANKCREQGFSYEFFNCIEKRTFLDKIKEFIK